MSTHYSRGAQLYNLGRYKDALKSFKESLTENPFDFYAKYHLALCYYHIEEIELFSKTTKSLLSDYPDSDEAHYLNSIYYSEIENFNLALKHINKAIEIEPYEANYFGQKSIFLINEKEFEEALQNANQGLTIDPKNPICLNARTRVLTKLNRKDEAYETLQNTLSDNPEDYFTHANAGWTNLELGNHIEAEIHFKEALQKDPNNDFAREGMLESIKSKNFIYRYFLKYAFWLQNKKSNFQWGFIIGLYLIYRFSAKILGELGFNFLVPFLIFLYLFFVLGTWIIQPTSNAILLFNNYGKYLLKKKDRISGMIFIFLVSTTIISSVLFYSLNNYTFLIIAISSLCSLIPLTKSVEKQNPLKNLAFWYGIIIFLFGVVNLFTTQNISISLPIGMFILYTWIHNILNTGK